jgi:hypothetical protein
MREHCVNSSLQILTAIGILNRNPPQAIEHRLRGIFLYGKHTGARINPSARL